MRTFFSLFMLLALLFCGCNLQPKYQPVPSPISDTWPAMPFSSGNKEETSTFDAREEESSLISWKDFFLDPYLKALIERALSNNRDLRIAALNIDQARTVTKLRHFQLFPLINASGSFLRKRASEDLKIADARKISDQYEMEFGVTAFEIDVFGKLRSLRESAFQNYLASKYAQASIQMSLIAEITNQYLIWMNCDKVLNLIQELLETYHQTLVLLEKSFEKGDRALDDVLKARRDLDSISTLVADYTLQMGYSKNLLTQLIGEATLPDNFNEKGNDKLQKIFMAVPEGLPSDLLERRPDIREAECLLKAAYADIGAVKAAFFPTISLTSQYGIASRELSRLFNSGNRNWMWQPQLSIPIFDNMTNKENLVFSEREKDIFVAKLKLSSKCLSGSL